MALTLDAESQRAVVPVDQRSDYGRARLQADEGRGTTRVVRAVRPGTTSAPRLASLDALRGFTIFWIIGGDALAWALKEMAGDQAGFWQSVAGGFSDQLQHVDWEGFSFYDLIFPLLIFVTGVSIVYSLSGVVEREGKTAAHLRVLRRVLLLYALGVIYYGGFRKYWPDIRLVGVLQRIAFCYLFASLLFLNFRLRDLIAAFVVLLVGYWALMSFVPVPGIGAGVFEQEANLAYWIDAHYLPGMKWAGTWDPEGLLSTLPAITTCLLGVFAGFLLKDARLAPQGKSLWLMAGGITAVLAGYLWGLQFPIIKNLWTSSFVLVAGGYSLLMLGVSYQVLDIWGHSRWSMIFVWIGANAITLYMLNNLMDFQQVAARLVGGDVGAFLDAHLAPGAGRLAAATVGLALAVVVANFLYRRKIFLRV
jgi:predicted acyltransferase